jgi:hypothetical protein
MTEAADQPDPGLLKTRKPRGRRESLVRPTEFPYPRGINSCELKFSRKGRKLAAAMEAYAGARLLPKLKARTNHTNGIRYDALSVDFMDACVYLKAWLGAGDRCGIAEFPFARLYPVTGGLYNVSVRRLIDWERVEDSPIWVAKDLFWNQAPNAKFWVKIAHHKTFEEAVEALACDPNF